MNNASAKLGVRFSGNSMDTGARVMVLRRKLSGSRLLSQSIGIAHDTAPIFRLQADNSRTRFVGPTDPKMTGAVFANSEDLGGTVS